MILLAIDGAFFLVELIIGMSMHSMCYEMVVLTESVQVMPYIRWRWLPMLFICSTMYCHYVSDYGRSEWHNLAAPKCTPTAGNEQKHWVP